MQRGGQYTWVDSERLSVNNERTTAWREREADTSFECVTNVSCSRGPPTHHHKRARRGGGLSPPFFSLPLCLLGFISPPAELIHPHTHTH
ncbi:hypothetical protein JOQ06_000511, partial [Pogonophryne albipinna]